MIKAVLLLALCVAVGGAIAVVFGPLLSPLLGSATSHIPQLSNIFGTIETQVIPFMQDKWQLITTAFTAIGVTGAISNLLHNKGVDNIKADFTQQVTEAQSVAISESRKVTEVTQKYDGLKQQYDTLVQNSKNVADITQKFDGKCKEVEKLQTEVNQLNRLLENKYIDLGVEQKLEEKKKVA